MKELLLFLAGATAATAATAATSTWTGSGGNSWSAAANWTPAAPVSGASTALVFDNATQPSTTNDFSGGLTLNSLTIGASSAARTIGGNPLIFSGTEPFIKVLGPVGNTRVDANLQLGANLTITGPYSLTSQVELRGNISGSGGMVLKSGVTTLQGTNTFTGPILLSDGALVGVNSTGAAAASGISVSAGCELQVHSFEVGVSANVNQPLILSGILSSDAKRIPVIGGTLPGGYYSGAITLAGDARIVALGGTGGDETNHVDFVISAPIARAGNAVSLEALSAFSGLTTVAITGNGTLELTEGRVTTGVVSGDGDVLTHDGVLATVASLTGTGTLDSQGDLTFTGAVSGNRNFAVSNGTVRLAATNSFTGSIVLSEDGVLQLPAESAMGAAANVIQFSQGGRVYFTSASSVAKPMSSTGGTGWIETADSVTISSPLTGTGGFGIASGGIATLTGNNPFTGGLSIGGITTFNNDSNLGTPGGVIRLGGSLSFPADYLTLSRPVVVQDNASITALGGSRTLAGNLTGSGLLTLGGNATFALTGTNTHSGGVAVLGEASSPATLLIDSDARLGGPSGVLNFGRLTSSQNLPGILKAAGNLTIAATRSTAFRDLTVDTNGFNVTFNQAMNGYGLVKRGAGTLRLNSVNSYTGGEQPLRIDQGTVTLGIDQALGNRVAITGITSGAVFDLNGFDQEFSGAISEAGSEIKVGAGSILNLRSGGTIDGAITGVGAVVLGKQGFTNYGTTFSGANSFSGGLTVREGMILTLGNAQALGAAGNPVTLDNGVLSVSSAAVSPLVIDGSVNLTIGSGGAGFRADGQSIVIQAALGGTAPLRFLGGSSMWDSTTHEVRLTNAANSFTGTVQLGQADYGDTRHGILGLTANGCLGNTANVVILGNTFYDGESNRSSSGGLRAYADFTLPASRAIRLNGHLNGSEAGGVIDSNGHTLSIAAGITELAEGMPLMKTGTGALHLDGANTFTGELIVQSGTLGGAGSIPGRLRFNNTATLAPGAAGAAGAIGTFTCGELEMTTDVTLAVDLSSAGGSDKLVVTGEAYLGGGATLAITPSGAVTVNSTFVVLQKSGSDPVSGVFTFEGELLEEGDTFTSGGIQWSVTYTGGDGNDVMLTALTGGGTPPTTPTVPKLTGITVTPAGAGGAGSLAKISATITGGPANTSIFLEASTDLGQLDPWVTIQTIPLDATGGGTISDATDPGSNGAPRNFFRLRTP